MSLRNEALKELEAEGRASYDQLFRDAVVREKDRLRRMQVKQPVKFKLIMAIHNLKEQFKCWTSTLSKTKQEKK